MAQKSSQDLAMIVPLICGMPVSNFAGDGMPNSLVVRGSVREVKPH